MGFIPAALRTDELTWELWFKADDVDQIRRLFRNRHFGYHMDVRLIGDDKTLQFVYATACTVGSYQRVLEVPVDADQWHHVAVTYSADAVSLYLDGVLVDQGAGGAVSYCGRSTFGFGRDADHNSRHYRGDLDEIAYFTAA